MAILADRNSIYSKLRGKFGDLVIKQYDGKTVVTKVPEMGHVKPSMLQKHQREQFRKFSPYYRHFIRQEGNRARLEQEMRAAGKRKLFQFFISRYCSGAVKRGDKGWVLEEKELPGI